MASRHIIPRYRPLAGLDDALCVYCGEPATDRDHALPVSVAGRCIAAGRTLSDEERRMLVTIPACRSCNTTLGSRYHPTMSDRLDDVRRRILARDPRARAQEWTETEIAGLGPNLRGLVADIQRMSDTTRTRITYHSPILDPDGPCAGLTGAPRALLVPGTLTLETISATGSLIAILDDLSVPTTATMAEAGSTLRQAGFMARQSLLVEAQRRRRGEKGTRTVRTQPDESWADQLRDAIR